jgi:hypothetical protein
VQPCGQEISLMTNDAVSRAPDDEGIHDECQSCERRLYRDRLMVAPPITPEEMPSLCLGVHTDECIAATLARIDRLYREAVSWRVGFTQAKEAIGADEHTDLVDAVADLRERAARMEQALRRIQQWDCLNPPAVHLCSDFPWLKKLVNDALDDAAYETKRSAAQAMSATKG